MRAYSVAATAFAIDAPAKWVDNVLTRFPVPSVRGGERQGQARRIGIEGVMRLGIVRLLNLQGIALPAAMSLADAALSDPQGSVELAGGINLSVDITHLRRELETRLGEAVEVVVVPRRGRPPRRP